MGIFGAALAQITVKSCRLVVWLCVILYLGLFRTMFTSTRKEALLSFKESKIFFSLATPAILNNFTGWMIFELQIVCLSNISGITRPMIAAGAIWVQCESTLAAVQTGWINSTSMRTLQLLGKQALHAKKSLMAQSLLSFGMIALLNIPLLLFSRGLSGVVSNDAQVQREFEKITYLLVSQSQSRILCCCLNSVFVPLDKGYLLLVSSFVVTYLISAPLGGITSLTTLVTSSTDVKIAACLGTTTLTQSLLGLGASFYLFRMDWEKAGRIISDRALSDKQAVDSRGLQSPLRSPMYVRSP